METEKAPAEVSTADPAAPVPPSEAPATVATAGEIHLASVNAAIAALKDTQAAAASDPVASAASDTAPSIDPELHVSQPASTSSRPELPRSGALPAFPSFGADAPPRLSRLPAPSAGFRQRAREQGAAEPRTPSRAGRFALLAASIAIAAGLGAAAGAAGFAGVSHWTAPPAVATAPARPTVSVEDVKALKDSVAQLRNSTKTISDSVAALRTQVETTSKGGQAQVARLSEAVERVERAQAEPAARLAKVTEAVERLERRNAPDVTGAVRQPQPLPPLRPEARTSAAVVDAWNLRRVYQGVALIESRFGQMEVEVGDDVRGVGRVQDIRRQDGRWVVVTNRGLIVQR